MTRGILENFRLLQTVGLPIFKKVDQFVNSYWARRLHHVEQVSLKGSPTVHLTTEVMKVGSYDPVV